MKVLVATTSGQGECPGDYCWTVEGELVTPVVVSCSEPGCGCRQGFSGLASTRATTTAMVADLDDVELGQLAGALQDSLRRDGWLRGLDVLDTIELIEEHLDAIEQVCAEFPVGTIVRRQDDLVWERRSSPPTTRR